jgi:hypothetical protein
MDLALDSGGRRNAPRGSGTGLAGHPGANITSSLLPVLFIFCPAKKIFKDFTWGCPRGNQAAWAYLYKNPASF